MRYQKTSESYDDTFLLAKNFTAYCNPGTVLLLDGDLAAGKTVFAKGIGAGLGVKGNIKSPSYTLMCQYEGDLIPFFHFDAYNLQGIDDFYALGFDEFLSEEGIVLVEWGSVIREGFPEDYIHIDIQKGEDENRRLFTFTPYGKAPQDILEGWWEHENTCL